MPPGDTCVIIGEMLEGFDRLLALAPDECHIVPGHDPLVMKLYLAPSPELEGIAVRLARIIHDSTSFFISPRCTRAIYLS